MTENNSSSQVVIEISGAERDTPRTCLSPNEPPKIPSTETLTRLESVSPNTPLMASPKAEDEDNDDEEIILRNTSKHRGLKVKALIERVVFVCIMGCLVASLTVHKLKHSMLWDLEIWKWCVLVMVTFSGLLVTNWFMSFAVILIAHNFPSHFNALYFIHGLKKSVGVCVWSGSILVTWVLLFNNNPEVQRSATARRILHYVTWTTVSLLIGSFLWLLKNLVLKILVASFHINNFLYRFSDAIFDWYVIDTLSGPPVMELAKMPARIKSSSQLCFRRTKSPSQLSFKRPQNRNKRNKKPGIDMNRIHQIKQEKVPSWTKKLLVDAISNSALSAFSVRADEGEQVDEKITSEAQATVRANQIFTNVTKPGCSYIDEMDLSRFMSEEEVDVVLVLLNAYETGRIKRKAFEHWLVKVYNADTALANSLSVKKTPVDEFNGLITGILIVVIIIVWLVLMGIATTKILLFISSQIVVAAFIFGNTCKNIFEAIIFVFVMHPFGVGDRCVIDGVQMTVEEIFILTTVFLKFDNEMIYYPNSVLATKPISNFNRSPDMGDSLEFSIDFRTPVDDIEKLKTKLRTYFENNPMYWDHNKHNVVVKEIENVDKLKIVVSVKHTMNFQDSEEKNRRRSALVIEIKKIFEELKINCNLLPQEVKLGEPETSTTETT